MPGNLTYSNFGGGAWGAPGVWTLPRFESASKCFIVSVGVRSPFCREPNALLKNRGKIRVCEEGRGKDKVGTGGIISEIEGCPLTDMESRRGGDDSAVEGRDRLWERGRDPLSSGILCDGIDTGGLSEPPNPAVLALS